MTGKGHCHPSMETCSSAVHGFCGEASRKDDHKNKTWWSLSRVNNYPPCARQDEQGKLWPSGLSFGVRNMGIIMFWFAFLLMS